MTSIGLEQVLRRRVVERVAYGTITIMCVLVVYDGWSQLKLLGVLGVIVGPIVAMFVSHVFSSSLAQQIDLGRTLNRAERIATVRSQSPFLLLAVPPAVLAIVMRGRYLAHTLRPHHSLVWSRHAWILGRPCRPSRRVHRMAPRAGGADRSRGRVAGPGD